MGAVAEVVGDVFEPIGEAVGQVEKAIESAASEVGHACEEVGKAVGQTVQAMADDPSKALILIAVCVLAPELAPLLWEGATIAEAAMVLNTGIQLAQGVDPLTIATNFLVDFFWSLVLFRNSCLNKTYSQPE
jgi:sorbitol-specific phosphotransferase system component IIBC